MIRSFPIWICACLLFACNEAGNNKNTDDSVNIDTLYPLPNDTNASGADTSDHNKGSVPTNNVDVQGPVVLPKDTIKKPVNKPKSKKNPHFDTTKA